jgi:hypothetical protein
MAPAPVIRLHPDDGVLIARSSLPPGLVVADGVTTLERIPAVVFHDECDNLVNVYQILNGRGPGFFGFDWKPQPAASVYLLSLSMRLGMSVVMLRLPAALFSVARPT